MNLIVQNQPKLSEHILNLIVIKFKMRVFSFYSASKNEYKIKITTRLTFSEIVVVVDLEIKLWMNFLRYKIQIECSKNLQSVSSANDIKFAHHFGNQIHKLHRLKFYDHFTWVCLKFYQLYLYKTYLYAYSDFM